MRRNYSSVGSRVANQPASWPNFAELAFFDNRFDGRILFCGKFSNTNAIKHSITSYVGVILDRKNLALFWFLFRQIVWQHWITGQFKH